MVLMERNYTPLDVRKLEARFPAKHREEGAPKTAFDSTFNTILILLATITVLVVSIVLFILIQKQIGTQPV